MLNHRREILVSLVYTADHRVQARKVPSITVEWRRSKIGRQRARPNSGLDFTTNSVHHSLEFSNLPLTRVEASVHFAVPDASPSLDQIWELRNQLADLLPITNDFMGGPRIGSPFSLNVGLGNGASFGSEDGACTFMIRNAGMSASWVRRSSDSAYPRFGTLREQIDRANAVIRTPVTAVTLSYVNAVPSEHGTIDELISSEVFPTIAERMPMIHEVNVSYRLEDQVDYRIQIARADFGFSLTTTAGMVSDEPIGALDLIHGALLREFSSLITDKAKKVWKLC